MFFAISKILSFLFLPVTQVFVFFVLYVFVKKQPWKKYFFWSYQGQKKRLPGGSLKISGGQFFFFLFDLLDHCIQRLVE